MNFPILKKIPLFYGVKPEEVASILHCLSGQIRSFSKGEMIFCAGESITSVGIVLEGSVHIEIDDFWGSKNILNHVGPGQLFGEAYACSPSEPLMVNVVSVTPSQILFLDVPKILHTCEKPCSHHQQMIENLLRIMATNNLQLSRRILHTTPKTIRERLLAYLSYQELLTGSPEITIAFNRQQLADYLSVDRSALSKESPCLCFYLLDFCIIQPLQLSPVPVHCCELRCRIQQLLPDPFSDRCSDSWQSPDL